MTAKARTDHALERMIFFSDAIFAIAMTLLVIEIEVPELPKSAGTGAYLEALSALIPSFVGYFISFAVIAAFWVSHHRAFAIAERYDPRILRWNVLLLGMIALMPWFTAFMSSNIRGLLPNAIYCGALTITALLNMRIVHLATSPPMASADSDPEAVRVVRRRSYGVALGAFTALLLGIALPPGQRQLGFLAIALWLRLLNVRRRSD